MAELAEAASTASADAREATATAEPSIPAAGEQAATPAEAAPSFDRDAAKRLLGAAPEDFYDELLKDAEPLRKRISAESSRAIQRAQQAANQEREQREALERDLILADESHDKHYEYVERYGTAATEAAKARVGLRAALSRPEVKSQALVDAGQVIVSQLMQHESVKALSAEDWQAALEQPDMGAALGDVIDRAVKARLKDLEPAIRLSAVDEWRREHLPNADLGGTRGGGGTPDLGDADAAMAAINERARERGYLTDGERKALKELRERAA